MLNLVWFKETLEHFELRRFLGGHSQTTSHKQATVISAGRIEALENALFTSVIGCRNTGQRVQAEQFDNVSEGCLIERPSVPTCPSGSAPESRLTNRRPAVWR